MTSSPERVRPGWFSDFLAARQTAKPSRHTVAAYCRDFDRIAELVVGPDVAALELEAITLATLRRAFATFAQTHAAASVRRCWSTWNTLCTFLLRSELLSVNPMPMIDRPKAGKSLPKALGPDVVDSLFAVLAADPTDGRRRQWPERDFAIIFVALLTGLRLDELVNLNIDDIRRTEDGAIIHVRHGKGDKDRRIPIETPLLDAIETYLSSRAVRFPHPRNRSRPGLSGWPGSAPLFVDAVDGERITRDTIQYRVLRLLRRAGVRRPSGALVHALRHTFATDLANANVSVYELQNLLGHESIATSQRYFAGAGQQTRAAAAQNPLYARLPSSPTGDADQG